MRRLALFFFCASAAYAQNHEILRPTMDVNSTSSGVGCAGTNQASGSMAASHDAAGLATSSNIFAIGSTSATHYKVRMFTTWATPTKTYTNLSLNINSSGIETVNSGTGGNLNIAYSLNGGSNWVNVENGGFGTIWTQKTDTVTLSTAQDFTKIQIAICVQSNANPSGEGADTETVTAWDIWTDGTYTSGAVGNGSSQGVPAIQPVFISEFVDLRRKLCVS